MKTESLESAAKRLGCSRATAMRLLKAGLLQRTPAYGRAVMVHSLSVDSTLRKLCAAGIRGVLKRRKPRPATEQRRDYFRARKYGVALGEVARRITEQGGCAICARPIAEDRCHVDHCHDTGAVRGILCATCNLGIGGLRDSPELAERAVSYLRNGLI